MKKSLSVVAAVFLCGIFVFSACGKDDGGKKDPAVYIEVQDPANGIPISENFTIS